ncbi:type II secretion system GspH family protein [Planktothrix agardhii 1806]|jgi:prepilin-type N-terminal cleavage/methylation domain-containing protein|uniref:type II secretion system protein n=1 Tax=Planktothrix agardhii TaxID=1160 RepID=UPI001F41F94A|nr:type II secretion system protein [Planktothrix agardhii]MCF3572862.1 type II secretion system GspH family protein [Planktothrix agardhii 1805]MCF3573736.1 type II secretion system GspH family protein [Planktothrix agardhii 1812]MCF3579196.1 type II secretion system GspH family protein [Planktothrix agardhii 1811]MCF3582393.1 type II secretion system GspH family protein [Planktothrix agardhii 1811]MCF3587513.1 type II secretion system GspH family protein [Planktothrix agardhii 1803]
MKSHQIFKILTFFRIAKSPHPNKGETGFSLIELLVVILMVGILSAIAAPGWQAFTTGQRLKTVNNQVFQAIKSAQAEAKLKKTDVTLEFFQGTATEAPKYQISTEPNKVSLNLEGEIKAGTIQIYAINNATPPKPEIKFDYLGTTKNAGFTVVSYLNNNKSSRQCVTVETILGTTRIPEKTNCPTPP